ncbi:MAG TPA: ATPase, T2SS/T4P/T4SS family [Acidocella sp.]|nr:ATPase, T2SS/T4P/T4SS family [Acidocella sp.]
MLAAEEAAVSAYGVSGDGRILPQDFGNLGQIEALNRLLEYVTRADASEIKFLSHHPVIAEIAGIQYPVTKAHLTTPLIRQVVEAIYGSKAGSGAVTSGEPLDGAYSILTNNERLRFRFNATACHAPGEQSLWLSLRTIPSSPRTLGELGIEPVIIDNLRPEKGIILVTGITGSGKTTLLAAIVRYHLEREKGSRSETIVTYEKPIEFVYDTIKRDRAIVAQHELGRDLRLSNGRDAEFGTSLWAHAIGNAMRQKPTIIILGEARDPDAYRALATASATGHLCYSTAHTTDVATTVFRMINELPPSQQSAFAVGLVANLQMIVCQSLIAKKGGGRVAVREYLIFTPEIRSELMSRPCDQWLNLLRNIMDRVTPDRGRKAIAHLREHYQAGLIEEEEMQRWEIQAKLGGIS